MPFDVYAPHVPRLRESRLLLVMHHVVLALPWLAVLLFAIVAVTNLALGPHEYVHELGFTVSQSQVPVALKAVAMVCLGIAFATAPIAGAFAVAGALARVPRHWNWTALWIAAWVILLTLPSMVLAG